jgi:N-acetyl-anhydromuramoyl-L-alanine amidase
VVSGKVTGWVGDHALAGLGVVHRLDSPNFDARPQGLQPHLLVLHYISLPANQFSGSNVEDFFLNRLKISAHPSFHELAGVKVSARAWHAGISKFLKQEGCNDFSIGIEIEGSGDFPYTKKQYQRLAKLTKLLCMFYPLRYVAGHSDIAPGRKQDPGPHFDWPLFLKSVEDTGLVRPY